MLHKSPKKIVLESDKYTHRMRRIALAVPLRWRSSETSVVIGEPAYITLGCFGASD